MRTEIKLKHQTHQAHTSVYRPPKALHIGGARETLIARDSKQHTLQYIFYNHIYVHQQTTHEQKKNNTTHERLNQMSIGMHCALLYDDVAHQIDTLVCYIYKCWGTFTRAAAIVIYTRFYIDAIYIRVWCSVEPASFRSQRFGSEQYKAMNETRRRLRATTGLAEG